MLRLRHTRTALVAAFIALCSACSSEQPDAPVQTVAGSSAGSFAGSSAGSTGSLVGGSSGVTGTTVGPSLVAGSAGPGGAGGGAGSMNAGSSAVAPSTNAGTGAGAAAMGGTGGASGQEPADPAKVDPSAPLTPIAFFPSKDRTNACADASVSIQFNRTPLIKAGGKIQIVEASGTVFDSVMSNPSSDLYFSNLVTRSSGAQSFRTDALDVVYNTVVFQPKAKLAYGKTYYVTIDAGTITDELGTQFSVTEADKWTFTVRDQAPASSSTYSLAADGSGDFCSVDGVLGALPGSASSPRVVNVATGVYPGIVRMSHSQVHFVGAGIDKSIFSQKNSATMNSSSREGFVVTGSDVRFEDLTIFNTYLKDSNGQQAEALYVTERSTRVFLKNVHLRSHQDTLRVDGSAYMEGGKISGSTDPLWGYGAFYCDGCELSSRTSGHSFVVTRSTKGFGLINCSVTKESDSVKSTYLAQYHDGNEPGKIAFAKCKMDSHVMGWKRAQGNAWYEYQNTKLQTGEPLKFDAKQLTDGSAELTALSSAKSWLGWSP